MIPIAATPVTMNGAAAGATKTLPIIAVFVANDATATPAAIPDVAVIEVAAIPAGIVAVYTNGAAMADAPIAADTTFVAVLISLLE